MRKRNGNEIDTDAAAGAASAAASDATTTQMVLKAAVSASKLVALTRH